MHLISRTASLLPVLLAVGLALAGCKPTTYRPPAPGPSVGLVMPCAAP